MELRFALCVGELQTVGKFRLVDFLPATERPKVCLLGLRKVQVGRLKNKREKERNVGAS